MDCVKSRKPLLAGATSSSSMIALILLPKCPLCLAMWLSMIGVTGVPARHVQACLIGLLLLLMVASGVRLLSFRLSSILTLAMAMAASYTIHRFSTGPFFSLAASAAILLWTFSVFYLPRAYRRSRGSRGNCHA
jgi:hypothetical protein